VFDATINIANIKPKDRYPTVFKTFQELKTGQKLKLINDHDLRPLLEYKLILDFPNQFKWSYWEQGPENWSVIVTKL